MAGISSRPGREQWRFYKRCHPLAVEYQAARHGRLGPITQFVKQCLQPGRVAAIDTFAPAVELIHPVDRGVELDSFNTVAQSWTPEISDSIFPENHTQYTTVVMLGEQWTKYKTPERYAELASNYKEWLQPQGNLIICMPVTHMVYHRLRYNIEQVLQQVNDLMPEDFKIRQHIRHHLNLYLEIKLCQ